jgi:type VI protein secretion system component Hcp
MELSVRRVTITGIALALFVVTIVSVWGGSSNNSSAQAAAAGPYGEMTIFKFQGTQKLITDIRDHTWGMTIPTSLAGGGGSGKAKLTQMTITRNASASSPLIAEKAALGEQFDRVRIEVFKPGTTQVAQSIELEDTQITTYTQSPGGAQTEVISFTFDKIEWIVGPNDFCWEVVEGATCLT